MCPIRTDSIQRYSLLGLYRLGRHLASTSSATHHDHILLESYLLSNIVSSFLVDFLDLLTKYSLYLLLTDSCNGRYRFQAFAPLDPLVDVLYDVHILFEK